MALLEWEEGLFRGLNALYRRLVAGPREQEQAETRARLRELRSSLFLLAQMIAGKAVSLFETDNAVLCDRERIFLPPTLTLARSREANTELYRLKTIVAALAIRRGVPCLPGQKLIDVLKPDLVAMPALSERLAAMDDALGDCDLWTWIGDPDFLRATDAPMSSVDNATAPAPAMAAEAVTEIEGAGQTDVTAIDGEDDQPIEAEMPIHTFEKVETVEEYNGLRRRTDDSDELEDHEEALRSVDMRHVIRSRERPRSIYRSDILLDGLASDVVGQDSIAGIPYPEWNYKNGTYRPDWCHVQETRQLGADLGWLADTERRHRQLVDDLKKQFASLASERLRAKRQPFGSELDLDVIVDNEVGRQAGQNPNELCYVDRCRSLHDLALLILLDQSFSTDAWIDDARVLDTIRDTIFCVGAVLEDFVEQFAIAAFSSNTRRQCIFHTVKDFDESWRDTRARLGGLEAYGYTRIGPALRHAQETLAVQHARRKVIILVTDGRPCDYDRYEGTYGIRDVKKAIETGRAQGILTHAFAVDSRAREHFPRMFTQHHYDIVPNPRALIRAMCGLFFKLETE